MLKSIVSLNEESLKADLRELVRRTIEEAGNLAGTERYELTADREAYRAGHCKCKLTTTYGEVAIRSRSSRG